jgi:hypothetical protein
MKNLCFVIILLAGTVTAQNAAVMIPLPPVNTMGNLPEETMNQPIELLETFADVSALTARGWIMQNLSNPQGTSGWFQGDRNTFHAWEGQGDGYIAAGHLSVKDAGIISNWLITPEIEIKSGNLLSFWTRTTTQNKWPDRLQVRLSLNGSSADAGTTATSVGDFVVLLADINDDYTDKYPTVWTEYQIVLSDIPNPGRGRIAFRYFVEDGGPDGSGSDYIGIDLVRYYSRYKVDYLAGTSGGTISATLYEEPINPGSFFNKGAEIIFYAIPEEGYRVSGWSMNGKEVKTGDGKDYLEDVFVLESLEEDISIAVSFEEAGNETSLNDAGLPFLQVFPNPASSGVKIVSPVPANELFISDITGRIVVRTGAFDDILNLDVHQLENGIYFIAVVSGENILKRKFVVFR